MSTSITTIFDTINSQVLSPFYYGLIGIVFMVALIVLIIRLVSTLTSPQGQEQRMNFKLCLIIMGVCLLMAFAPGLINWVVSLSGSGMSGVSV